MRTTLALTIDQSRGVFVNGQKITDNKQMEDMLRRAVTQNPDIQAVVTADNSVPYGDFVQLIDAVRLSGIKKYALTVTEKPRSTSSCAAERPATPPPSTATVPGGMARRYTGSSSTGPTSSHAAGSATSKPVLRSSTCTSAPSCSSSDTIAAPIPENPAPITTTS